MTCPKWWEVLLWALSASLAILLAVQRNLVFSKGRYGMLTEDSLPLFLWGLICVVALLASKPWRPVSRFGAPLRYIGLILAGGSTLFVLLCTTDWGRYQLLRFEALHSNLAITNFGEVRLSRTITEEPGVGEKLARDPALRSYIFDSSGSDFLGNPPAAAVLTALELENRSTFDDLLQRPHGPEILLACLVNEANPNRWKELPWFAPPPGPVLDERQSRELVAQLAGRADSQTPELLESLLFVAMFSPHLFDDDRLQHVFEAWAAGFDDLQPLAVEGLLVREQVKQMLPPGEEEVKVALEVTGGVPSSYYYRNTDKMARLMLLGLVRSCGRRVTEVPPALAQLKISVALSQVAHHTYLKPTYDYETYYEYRSTGRLNSYRTHRIAKQRQVISGHTEETAYAPVARITLSSPGETVELPEMLLFWHHLRYDHEKGTFMDLKSEETYGRMWPFGLHKSLFEWEE